MLKSCRRNVLALFVLVAVLASADNSHGARLEISTVQNAFPGWWASVKVSADNLGTEISAFTITLAVDQNAYGVVKVDPGQFCQECEWEYFTYRTVRHDSLPEFDLMGNTDLLTVTGVASATDGYTPLCYGSESSIDLVEIELLVDYETRYALRPVVCTFLPIRFFWRDCDDNILYTRNGDTVYTAATVTDPLNGDLVDAPFPGFGVPDPPCPDQPGLAAVNLLDLLNGGLDMICCDTIDSWRGDLNLNGRPYEVADLVTYNCYFIWGLACFSVFPEVQIAQSDINGDGMPLSIVDLVYLQHLLVHHITPVHKSASPPSDAYVYLNSFRGKTALSLDVHTDISAVYLRFVGEPDDILVPSDISFAGPVFEMGRIGDTTTMILFDLEQGNPVLESGSHLLFEYADRDVRLVEVAVVDQQAASCAVKFGNAALPNVFTLGRNYPNPFNPFTTVEFFLPSWSEWKLSIHNVLGQKVNEFTGSGQGDMRVSWDGCDAGGVALASGVYFYRLESGGMTETRKMILMK